MILPLCTLIIARRAKHGKEYGTICSNKHDHQHNANQPPHEHRLKVIGLTFLCAGAKCPHKHHDNVQARNAKNQCRHHPVCKAYRLLKLTVAGLIGLLLLIGLLVRLLLVWLLLLILSLFSILVSLVK